MSYLQLEFHKNRIIIKTTLHFQSQPVSDGVLLRGGMQWGKWERCLFVLLTKVSHPRAPTRSSVAATFLLISPTPPLPASPAQSVIRLPWQRSAYGRQRSDHYGLRDPESEGHDFFFFPLFFSPLAPSFLLRLSCCKHRKWEHLEAGPVLDAALSQQRQV